MSWFSRKDPTPAVPPYVAPITRTHSQEREDEQILVEEIDTSAMTRTGVHRAWDKLTGRFKGE